MSQSIVRLFVSERKQIAPMADEKLPARISHRLFATSRSEMGIIMCRDILIAVYSNTGNTNRIARVLQTITGGELVEVFPAQPYPGDGSLMKRQVESEIKCGECPPLLAVRSCYIKRFGCLFAGTPNWFGSIAPPLASFLKNYSFTQKTIIPFVSHDGGGAGDVRSEIQKICPHADVTEALCVYKDGGEGLEEQITEFLRSIDWKEYT